MLSGKSSRAASAALAGSNVYYSLTKGQAAIRD
jgi:hypothetical protein